MARIYNVACQAHPALVKLGLVLARLFHFNSLLVCTRLDKILRMPCVCDKRLVVSGLVHLCMDSVRRPRPAGMRQYTLYILII